jgi:hypothetical protein
MHPSISARREKRGDKMQLCNETITVFNARLDAETGFDVYSPTVINGVSWHCELASTVDSSGLKAANKFTIRIPADADCSGKAFAPPPEYTGLEASGYFTLRSGDIVVKGAVTGSLRPAELLKQYEGGTILGVSDNRRGRSPHWKVVGS